MSRMDALCWLTTASTPSNSCLNSPHVFAAAAPEDKNVSLHWGSHSLCPSLTQEHQSCTSEDYAKRCTGAEATLLRMLQRTLILWQCFWGIQTEFPASPRSNTHTERSRRWADFSEDQPVKFCYTRRFGNSRADYNQEGNTSWQTRSLRELEAQCTQQDSGLGAQRMLRQQKGSVKDCLEQLQSISQSTAYGKKRNFYLFLSLGKHKWGGNGF